MYNDKANASRAEERRGQLLASLAADGGSDHYVLVNPAGANRFSLLPGTASDSYDAWPALPEIAGLPPFSGVLEKRRGSLLSYDKVELAERMRRYFDPDTTAAELRLSRTGPVEDMARFDAEQARVRLLREETYSDEALRRITLYPFEVRWAYHTNRRPIWNEPRPELVKRVFPGNAFLVTRFRARRPGEGAPMVWTPLLPGDHLLDPNAHPLPVLADPHRANLSTGAHAWLAALGFPDPDTDHAIAALPWHHALAIGYAPAWLAENADGIRQGWPRVPLPGDPAILRASSALGARVAELLDPDAPVPGVTTGAIRPEFQAIAVPTKRGGGAMTEADRAVTAGWGSAGKDGAVMPGRGRLVQRDYTAEEAASAPAAALGARTNDVYLNPDAYWRNVPEAVWDCTIGGYQVLKKWLSYRERPLLRRALTPGEVRYVRDIARRLAALALMQPELDANYRSCAAAHAAMPGSSAPS